MYTTSDESFNGYTNWDTWNASLWLANDEYAYHIMGDAAAPSLGMSGAPSLGMSEFADIGQDMIDEIGNPDGIEFENVNWKEVREGFVEE